MPNVCKNTLTVTGPAAGVGRFVEAALGMSATFAPDPRLREIMVEDPAPAALEPLSFHALVPIPAGALALPYDTSAIEGSPRYEGKLGFEWERELWGCKWGATESKLVGIEQENDRAIATYTYDTAWNPAETFFSRVSARFSMLTFEVQWAIEEGKEGFGRFEAKAGEVREKWPDWLADTWQLGTVPEEIEARVGRVTSCDAWYDLTQARAPFLLFDRPSSRTPWELFESLPPASVRSGLDYVEAWMKDGTGVKFYVDARQCYSGATYLFRTTGQTLSLRAEGYWTDDEDEPGAGRRAAAQRLWPPR